MSYCFLLLDFDGRIDNTLVLVPLHIKHQIGGS